MPLPMLNTKSDSIENHPTETFESLSDWDYAGYRPGNPHKNVLAFIKNYFIYTVALRGGFLILLPKIL